MSCMKPNKPRHKNKTDAEHAIKVLSYRKDIEGLYAYSCGDHWHVGHELLAKQYSRKRRGVSNAKRHRRIAGSQ